MSHVLLVGGGGGRSYRAELADGFPLEVVFVLGGFDVKTQAGREITAVAGWVVGVVAFVEMIKVNFGMDVPDQVVHFQETAGKQGMGVFLVELLHVVENIVRGGRQALHRHGDEGVELPVVVIQQAQTPAGKAVDGVAHRVSGDQASAAEIQGLPAGNRFRADAAIEQVLIGPSQIALDKIGGVGMGVIDAGAGVRIQGAGIQKFRSQPERTHPRLQPDIRLQGDLLVAARAISLKTAVHGFVAGTLFHG